MPLVNCTPHALTIYSADGSAVVATIPDSGTVARVTSSATSAGYVTVDGHLVPVVVTVFGAVQDLPAPADGTVYVVSGVVLAALAGTRPDVVGPDTGQGSVVRDDGGKILGVRRFTR